MANYFYQEFQPFNETFFFFTIFQMNFNSDHDKHEDKLF